MGLLYHDCGVSPCSDPSEFIVKYVFEKGKTCQIHLCKTSSIQGSQLEPKEIFCPDGKAGCKRGDLFAFEFICGSVFLYQSLMSLRAWHFSDQFKVPSTPESRVFGYNEQSEKLAAFSFVFQV